MYWLVLEYVEFVECGIIDNDSILVSSECGWLPAVGFQQCPDTWCFKACTILSVDSWSLTKLRWMLFNFNRCTLKSIILGPVYIPFFFIVFLQLWNSIYVCSLFGCCVFSSMNVLLVVSNYTSSSSSLQEELFWSRSVYSRVGIFQQWMIPTFRLSTNWQLWLWYVLQ